MRSPAGVNSREVSLAPWPFHAVPYRHSPVAARRLVDISGSNQLRASVSP